MGRPIGGRKPMGFWKGWPCRRGFDRLVSWLAAIGRTPPLANYASSTVGQRRVSWSAAVSLGARGVTHVPAARIRRV